MQAGGTSSAWKQCCILWKITFVTRKCHSNSYIEREKRSGFLNWTKSLGDLVQVWDFNEWKLSASQKSHRQHCPIHWASSSNWHLLFTGCKGWMPTLPAPKWGLLTKKRETKLLKHQWTTSLSQVSNNVCSTLIKWRLWELLGTNLLNGMPPLNKSTIANGLICHCGQYYSVLGYWYHFPWLKFPVLCKHQPPKSQWHFVKMPNTPNLMWLHQDQTNLD